MRLIDADKIDFRMPAMLDDDGTILVPLSAVRQAIANTPTIHQPFVCPNCGAVLSNTIYNKMEDFTDDRK